MPEVFAKSIDRVPLPGAIISVVALALCAPSVVNADSFTVTLTPAEQTGAHGSYLSAPFDFGTAFSQIDSVTLQFVMPDGYQGTALTTGNSSVFRSLESLMHGAEAPVPGNWLNSASTLTSSMFRVSPNVPAEFWFVYSLGEDGLTLVWPDFLHTGRGRLALADVVHASYHPLPDGIPINSSTAWILPGEIESAQLTIVGTAVPEPNSVVLVVAGVIVFLTCCWFRQRRLHADVVASRC